MYVLAGLLSILFFVGLSDAIDLGDILKKSAELISEDDEDEGPKIKMPVAEDGSIEFPELPSFTLDWSKSAFPDVWELQQARCVENCPDGTDAVKEPQVFERRSIKIPAVIGEWVRDE
jgi:hypothetical protein